MKRTRIQTLSQLVSQARFMSLVSTGKFQLRLMVYIGGVLVSLIPGRIHCGYACPMTTFMRPAEKISRKPEVWRQHPPRWL